MIKQTGFLYELRPSDFILGVSSPITGVEYIQDGNWKPYQPDGEKQYKYATFDTFSCTSFSFANIVETVVNYFDKNNMWYSGQRDKLNSLGFYSDGKFNISDRALAIMSGTMPNGNYFQNVGDACRKQGLLPEALLPFGGNNQAEYLNKDLITPELASKALEILNILDISYEWVGLNQEQINAINSQIKQAPIWAAIPIPGTHAVEVIAPGEYFDSYEPYIKKLPLVHYTMKVNVSIKKPVAKYKYFNTKSDRKMIGVSEDLMYKLDAMRTECGFPFRITSGYRTVAYNNTLKNAVEDSAHTLGLAVDISCTASRKRSKMIRSALNNGITRIGVGSNYLHFDIDTSKPQNVVWLYS